MAQTVVRPARNRRTASREERRKQLVKATMKCIAKRGIGSTTLAHVAAEAGLSQGIVNLHFKSKENLLNQTLRMLAEEYKQQFYGTLEKSGPSAADKLYALMEMDLKPSVCDRQKLAVWFAFWSEVKAMPTYRKICNVYDLAYDQEVIGLCETIIAEGAYKNVDAGTVTEALASLTNGLWLSCLISPRRWDASVGMQAVNSYLQAIFPKHYKNDSGALPGSARVRKGGKK